MNGNNPRVLTENCEEAREVCLHHVFNDCPKPERNCAEDYDQGHSVNNYVCDVYVPRLQINYAALRKRIEDECREKRIISETLSVNELRRIELWVNVINSGLIDLGSRAQKRLSLKEMVYNFVEEFKDERDRGKTGRPIIETYFNPATPD